MVSLGLDLAEVRSKLEKHAESEHSSSDKELLEFSEASQRVLSTARTEAYMSFDGQVGTEHILLGLVVAEEGLASRILKEGGIETEAARAAVRKMVDSAE